MVFSKGSRVIYKEHRVMMNKLAPPHSLQFISCLFKVWSGTARNQNPLICLSLTCYLFTPPSVWLPSPRSSTLLKGHQGTTGNLSHRLDKLRRQLLGSIMLFVLPPSSLRFTSITFSALAQRIRDEYFNPLCKIIITTTTIRAPSRER